MVQYGYTLSLHLPLEKLLEGQIVKFVKTGRAKTDQLASKANPVKESAKGLKNEKQKSNSKHMERNRSSVDIAEEGDDDESSIERGSRDANHRTCLSQ